MSGVTEVVTWYTPAESIPDADETVICRWDEEEISEDSDTIDRGYTDGVRWYTTDGMPIAKPREWTRMPVGSGR